MKLATYKYLSSENGNTRLLSKNNHNMILFYFSLPRLQKWIIQFIIHFIVIAWSPDICYKVKYQARHQKVQWLTSSETRAKYSQGTRKNSKWEKNLTKKRREEKLKSPWGQSLYQMVFSLCCSLIEQKKIQKIFCPIRSQYLPSIWNWSVKSLPSKALTFPSYFSLSFFFTARFDFFPILTTRMNG